MINVLNAGFRVLVLCGLACMLPGCGSHGSGDVPPSGQVSGIDGHTVVGPECPVMRAASPCPDKPLRARLTVTSIGSPVTLATVTSDAEGYFRIPLAPGRYTVRPGNLSRAALPTAHVVTATVVSGRFTVLTISFDSGIR